MNSCANLDEQLGHLEPFEVFDRRLELLEPIRGDTVRPLPMTRRVLFRAALKYLEAQGVECPILKVYQECYSEVNQLSIPVPTADDSKCQMYGQVRSLKLLLYDRQNIEVRVILRSKTCQQWDKSQEKWVSMSTRQFDGNVSILKMHESYFAEWKCMEGQDITFI